MQRGTEFTRFAHETKGTGATRTSKKAMLQIHTYNLKNTYRPYDLQGTTMPAANKAEWLSSKCLKKTGSSGKPRVHCARSKYLGPDAAESIPE